MASLEYYNLSFGGTASLSVYQTGVAMAFHRHGQKVLEKTRNIAGASAGAIPAGLLATAPDKIQPVLAGTRKIIEDIFKNKGITPSYDLTSRVRRLLSVQIPKDAHTRIGDRQLYISVMTFEKVKDPQPAFNVNDAAAWKMLGKKAWEVFVDIHEFKEEVITEFGSREELIEVLSGSAHIPIWGGIKHPLYRGKKLMDPGLKLYVPDKGYVYPENVHVNPSRFRGYGKTITISSLYSDEVTITPIKQKGDEIKVTGQPIDLTKWNYLYAQDAYHPPPWENMKEYYVRGYEDTKVYLTHEDLFTRS
ncbi:patatin-like phospholipase domain-containing protein 4 [Ptychodera flava]|uniref:patatin-like phospholipase domain-containing protein 4 n=1 Tax=Ptychodera flava TaxID=63121 RepID=UPI003969F10C